LRAAGARWVRVEYKQPRGVQPHRDVIDSMHAEGIRVLLIVDYSSVPGKPASNAPASEWDAYVEAYRAGVEQIAAELGSSVDAWQIWNEPDLDDPGGAYDPGVPAAHFGRMLQEASAAIRARSSGRIVTGGLASGDPGYLRDALDGRPAPVDAIAVHPYGQRAPDGWPDPSWGFGDMSNLFDGYLAFGRPLWVSEIGTVDSPRSAEYLTNVYTLATGEYAGRVEVVLWFCWSDAMVPPFGIHNSDGTPKAAYQAYSLATPDWDPVCEPPL
ncbi:MAG: glycoside hydrolase family 5 protein, partial [Sandaracinaceae bacterium]|nr:glycoside hydrolase family 5 protein [Sandaracinaceae bacterium]